MDHSLPSLFFVQGVAFVSELPVGLARLRRVKPPDARLVVIFCGLGEFPIASDVWTVVKLSAKPGTEQVPRGFARSGQGLIMRNPTSTARDLRRQEAYGRLAAIDAHRLWTQGCSLYFIAGRADTTIPFVRRWLREGAPRSLPGLNGIQETRAEFNSEVSASGSNLTLGAPA